MLRILSYLDTQELASNVIRSCQSFRAISHLLLEKRLKYKIQNLVPGIKESYFRKEMERIIQIKNLTESIKCLVLEDMGLESQIFVDIGYRELNEKIFQWPETWKNLSECEKVFDTGMICRFPYKMIDRQDVAYNDFVQDFINSCVSLESLFYVKFIFIFT